MPTYTIIPRPLLERFLRRCEELEAQREYRHQPSTESARRYEEENRNAARRREWEEKQR